MLLTGATGFIGAELRRALNAAGHTVTPVVRHSISREPAAFQADLLTSDRLAWATGEHDFILHAASKTQGTPDLLWQANAVATQRLASAAARTRTPMLYISTTGVYGRSFGCFGDPSKIPRQPSSALSVARAAAEDHVLSGGGTVIRPHVVLGPGDRWVAPPLARFMLAEDAWIGSSDVRVAGITSRRLAQGVAALIGRASLSPVLHAAEEEPVSVADIVRPEFEAAHRPLPERTMTIDIAYNKLRATGVSRNALCMLGLSSSMDAREFWRPSLPACNGTRAEWPDSIKR
ncbi:NAD-dependent epimerase/dehydratase family protein [Curtobacterium flaccumfaciens]|uniref:NAD-dependent epimerase/dehydratase family protein n=1 Tax=Curtobacterium flaccumfaciens TaxID=2035 RepID=UPI001BDF223F|nr:NAD(P)-dependent oxidoreductase [Curtobacterium flaccumfaciens]MBT1595667.1 NAD(P)-dependent oxidoreductase [Curtobacterium flaccumfaciens pv. flaccumfaciens]